MNQNEQLKSLRATLGLTQHDLAQRIGVSESSVHYFEAGKHSEGFTSGARAKITAYMKAYENNENDDITYSGKNTAAGLGHIRMFSSWAKKLRRFNSWHSLNLSTDSNIQEEGSLSS